MAKEKFERNKPHANIGTIGHVDHGKTTLTRRSRSISVISRLMMRLMVRLRKKRVVSRFQRLTLSMRRKIVTMLTSTAQVTLTMLRT